MTLTIDVAGRIVIPKSMRDQIGLSAGSELEIHLKDGRLELEPVSKVRLERRGGHLVAVLREGTPPMPAELVEKTLNDLREGRIR